jgi:hypothetical protein
MFGTQMVGAIHGRLLTAWSVAGILGPFLMTYIRDVQLAHGVPKAQVYDVTMYILVGLLVLGFVCNLLIRPVDPKYQMTDDELAAEKRKSREVVMSGAGVEASTAASFTPTVLLAWLAVGIPIAWGAWLTLQKALVLF